MWDFIKRWHPILLLAMGIYLAIPKPGPNPAEVDEEFLAEYDKNDNGTIEKDEFSGGDADFALRDRNDDKVLTVGSRFRWPLHDYKWNLGQDLKGGSSIRYVLIQQDMDEAEKQIRELLEPLKENQDKLSPEARAKFGDAISGGELSVDMWTTEDFNLLNNVPGLYDEGRADALRRYYETWNAAKQRKDTGDLVGPTIETLNRRLGATGITELNISPLGENRIEVKLPEFSTGAETDRYKQLLETTGKLEMRVLASEDGDFSKLSVGELPKEEGYKYHWLELARDDVRSGLVKESNGKKYVPVQVIDEYNITGRSLDDIQPTTDRNGGIAVSFALKGTAVARFEALTSVHKKAGEDPRLLAIIIDGKVYSAYSIEDTISGNVQLSGNFSTQERDDIINVLKSGSLNVKLQLEGEESVGPSEGAEAVKRGLWSLVIAAIGVFVIALLVYRGLGLLTIFNLVMVVVLIMGAMSAGLGTLTMPGIAGVVLTIGMAIDANILINERIREESLTNQNTRGAVEEGFKNALSAIVDSNVTTLLTAIILFKVGSGPIQGFALTLAIGIVATMYTALTAYKAMLMGILNVKRDIKFNMASLKFLRNTNINFTGYLVHGVIISAILVAIGGFMLATHGKEVLGIEFRGGHTFRVQMKQGYDRDTIAKELVDESAGTAKYDWAANAEIQPVYRLGSDLEAGLADRFDLRFPMRTEWESQDPEAITEMLQGEIEKVYADYLVADGWNAETRDVRQVTLRAVIPLKLKDPAKFREDHPEEADQLWLIHDRAWKGDVNAPRTNREKWFGALAATNDDVSGSFVTNAAGDRQTYTLEIRNVVIASPAELEQKRRDFDAAVNRNFLQDSQTVEAAAPIRFSYAPTQATLKIHVALLSAVPVKDFTEAVEGALPGESLLVTPVNPDAEAASEFDIVSEGTMTFSADADNPASFEQVQALLNSKVSEWLKSIEPEGNEISKRFLLSSAVGATVAAESQWRALFAILAALVVIVIYIRIRFASMAWGIAAVVGLVHDTFLVIAAIGIADYFGADIKIDLTVVAALLTVIGYSLNNTIIEFDRTRENLKKDRLLTGGKTPLRQVINDAVNQMLSRTMLTSSTTLVTTVAMLIFGGPLLKGFAFAMTIGVFVGTFSSVYIAGPVRILLSRGTDEFLDISPEEEAAEHRRKTEEAAGDEEPEAEEPDAEEADEKPETKDEDAKPEAKDEDKKD